MMQRLAVGPWCRRGASSALLRAPPPFPGPARPPPLTGLSGTTGGGTRWLAIRMASKPSSDAPPPGPAPGSEPGPQGAEPEPDPLQDGSAGLVQRFRRTLRQYGRVMVPVHLVTSSMWIGAFYYAAMKGVNVVPFLELVGFPERLVNLLEKSQSGYALTAYAMYKIATPARYTVTLGGTSLSVKYLRRHGYLPTPPPMTGYLQDKMEDARDRLSEKMEETRGRLSERMGETKDKLSGRLQDTKDKVSFRKKTPE